MPQVSIKINDQNYTVTCDAGQEGRLQDLAEYFDDHVTSLTSQVGNIADSRLMLLAGLTICDELLEARSHIQALETSTGMIKEDGALRVVQNTTQKIIDLGAKLEETASQV